MFRGDDVIVFHKQQGFKDLGHGLAFRVNADQGIRVKITQNWRVNFEYDIRYNSLPVSGLKMTDIKYYLLVQLRSLNHKSRFLFRLTPVSSLLCLSGTPILILHRCDEQSCCSWFWQVCGACPRRRPQKKDGLSEVVGFSIIPMTSACFPPLAASAGTAKRLWVYLCTSRYGVFFLGG